MTLTELSYYSRRLIPLIIFFLIMTGFFIIGAKFFFSIINSTSKPNTITINPVFNKIKPAVIKDASKSAGFQFTLDTIEGEPITATATAKVFFLPQNPVRFGYREKIYVIAKTLGFDTEVIKHQMINNEALFEDGRQRLQIDILNYNFNYIYNFEDDSALFEKTVNPQKKESENKAIDFLKSIDRYPAELALGKTNTIFWSYNKEEKKMRVVDNNLEANMVEVDFYRPDIDQYPVVSPRYYNSQNYVLMIAQEESLRVVKAQVKFYEKSESQVGIYPLITGNQAYENLKNGYGYIISLNNPNKKDIVIKKMFLGYYDPDFYQEYLQPVYVFLGEDNFIAYVIAVDVNYLSE